MYDVDTMVEAYLEAALWSSTDGDDEPLDALYSVNDFTHTARKRALDDCTRFATENAALLTDPSVPEKCGPKMAGHDLWLTRNGHGAGFWDGDWSDEVGDRLTEAAHKFGEVSVEVNGNGDLEFMP